MSSGSKPRNGLVSCPGASSHGCTKLIPKKEKQGRRKRKEEKNEKKGKKEKRKKGKEKKKTKIFVVPFCNCHILQVLY